MFYGVYNDDPVLNREEADDFKWIDMETLKNDIDNNQINTQYGLK